MLPNWLYGKSKSKLASILGGGGGAPADYNQVKAQVNQNTEDILLLSDALDDKAALTQITNPNLLDNPWFTVNQRGQSSYNGNGYSVDRWRGWNATNDIIVTPNGISSFGLWQYLDNSLTSFLLGRTITMSIKMQNGNIHSETVTLPATEPSQDANFLYSNNSDDNIAFTIDYEISRGVTFVSIRSLNGNNPVLVRAVKLEFGSVSTIAMDTAPNYQQELAKCQRYFYRANMNIHCTYGIAMAQSATVARMPYQTPVPMRIKPNITFDDISAFRLINGSTNLPITNGILYGADNTDKFYLELYATTIAGTIYTLNMNATSYIDFAAEL